MNIKSGIFFIILNCLAALQGCWNSHFTAFIFIVLAVDCGLILTLMIGHQAENYRADALEDLVHDLEEELCQTRARLRATLG